MIYSLFMLKVPLNANQPTLSVITVMQFTVEDKQSLNGSDWVKIMDKKCLTIFLTDDEVLLC